MLLKVELGERPVFELGIGSGFSFVLGGWDVVLHRPGHWRTPMPFSWETDEPQDLGPQWYWGPPLRCHNTTATWGRWELIVSRSYPVDCLLGDDDAKEEACRRSATRPSKASSTRGAKAQARAMKKPTKRRRDS
ncbi:hypothetical protein [Hyphomicrobium sp.]|uniref:hypothetical protein n=1 Tax=Hyphomicrobium sp. TaxID=82 RepID=UPI0025C25986|nr:hypothetical protein [Hyphomicrobium sp.]